MSAEMPVTEDQRLSRFHDARLVGVTYMEEHAIQLDFVATDSARLRLTLRGVVYFFCSRMLEGNIVESIDVIATNDVAADDLKFFVEKEGRGQSVDNLARTIRDKNLRMVLLSPSYGAEVGCVCSSLELTEP